MTYIIIPARLESNRLPRKLLLNETGKPLIQHTWENCCKVPYAKVLIATSNEELYEICKAFGADVAWTEPSQCGTERVVKKALEIKDCEVVVNVQGEWPDVNPDSIKEAINCVQAKTWPAMSSLYYSGPAVDNPDLVKVVVAYQHPSYKKALYFSRANVPYNSSILNYHIGVYALNREMQKRYIQLRDNELLQTEKLEQLKVLTECHIDMFESPKAIGVDNEESYQEFVRSQKQV